MDANELRVILIRHKEWLLGESDGKRADLFEADLSGADLRGADLRWANLCYADLSWANLYGADLSWAILCGANLRRANLYNADLRGANLRWADLFGADLFGATNLPDLSWTSIVPEEGAFIGWKKVNQFIVKLEICEYAKRSNATGRKCRCSAAKVLDIQNEDGTPAIDHDGTLITSVINTNVGPRTTYSVGEVVLPDSFDDNRWDECTHGIHFFITRQEAVDC